LSQRPQRHQSNAVIVVSPAHGLSQRPKWLAATRHFERLPWAGLTTMTAFDWCRCGRRRPASSIATMLKKIAVTELRLGMHVERFEGAWIDHPFWRSRFVLTSQADLRAARSSAVRECWIDTDAGVDVAAAAPVAPAPAAAPVQPAEPLPVPAESTSFDEELRRAAEVCRRGRAAVMSMFGEARLGHAVDPQQCLPLVQEISDSVSRNRGALVSLARLKTADDYSYMHSVAVCALMVSLGRTLGLDDAACREAGLAGLLHDMGKALMPIEVLNKPGKLTDAEFAIMRTHPERGHDLLRAGQGAPEAVLEVCLHHHERIDGTGYPHRLADQQITLLARMGAVCDVYDAITSNRPYKAGWDPADSLARMASWTGHFDTQVFAGFVKSLGIYPSGSLVRLASGRLAVVEQQNPQVLTAPVVKVFFSTQTNLPVSVERVDLTRGGDRIVCRESRGAWNFPQLESIWLGDAAI
jgi:HD-GYP domain-containing protein (c-di-GMP phosphodiesterase class II)